MKLTQEAFITGRYPLNASEIRVVAQSQTDGRGVEFSVTPEESEFVRVGQKVAIALEFEAPGKDSQFVQPEVTERHARFLRDRGYPVADLEAAIAFASRIEPQNVAGFFADAANWTEPAVTQPEASDDTKPATADDSSAAQHETGDEAKQADADKNGDGGNE